jgi:hypothetical protein
MLLHSIVELLPVLQSPEVSYDMINCVIHVTPSMVKATALTMSSKSSWEAMLSRLVAYKVLPHCCVLRERSRSQACITGNPSADVSSYERRLQS